MSNSEKKKCCLRVVWRGQSNKKWETVSVIPQIQFGDSTRFLRKRCAFKALQFIRSLASNIKAWNDLTLTTRNLESLNSFKSLINNQSTKVPAHYYVGCRLGQILLARLRMNCSAYVEYLQFLELTQLKIGVFYCN
jgi:hypothetical protein